MVALKISTCWSTACANIADFFLHILRAHLKLFPSLAPGYLKIALLFVPHRPPKPKYSSPNPNKWGNDCVLRGPGPTSPNISSSSPKWRTFTLPALSQRPSSLVCSAATWRAPASLSLLLIGQQPVPALSSRSLHTGPGPALAHSHLSEEQ